MPQKPSLLLSVIPILTLIGMMFFSVYLFGSDSLCGGSQVSLLVSVAMCVALAKGFCGVSWKHIETGIKTTLGESSIPIVILLMIGMLSSTWMVSGIVPTFIYYGVQIISPKFFLLCACLLCAVISLLSGSSWTTIATIGIALLGIGNALGISECWTAGAIISGAYFGDKISPLSDTTVLASSSSGTELFTHIRYMLITTVPSFLITLTIFGIYGYVYAGQADIHIDEYITGLDAKFNITLWVLLVPLATGIMVYKKVPSVVTLFVSSILACICAWITQPDVLIEIGKTAGLSTPMTIIKGTMMTLFTSTAIDTDSENVNGLVATSGMAGMLNTVWLVLCSMSFGGVMMASGMIGSISESIIRCIRNRVSLVGSTVLNGIVMNLTASDQFLSIILTANLFSDVYKRQGYETRLLSRSTEDSATVTSVLIPWNSCGMTQASVLGVATIAYLPYCFFNYISPLMSIIIATTGFKIKKIS